MKQRVITAVIALIIFLPLLYLGNIDGDRRHVRIFDHEKEITRVI